MRGIQRVVANRTLAGIQTTARVAAMAELDAVTIEVDTVIEYHEVNVAVALALPSDILLAVVIKRADECPLPRS